jgi:hypothetical protein
LGSENEERRGSGRRRRSGGARKEAKTVEEWRCGRVVRLKKKRKKKGKKIELGTSTNIIRRVRA